MSDALVAWQTAGGDSVTELQDSGTGPSVPIAFDAFISYSRRDAGAVVGFVRAAERRDRSIWFDADDIPAGAPWREELATAIEVSDAVVCCLSRDWSGSAECQREYDRAVQLGKRLVPVVVATMRDPPAELAALQWIDARDGADPEHVATQVLAAIDADHERVREHTHWLSRALRWESSGSENSLLLRGKDLVAAEEWMSREAADPSPTALQRRFIGSSRQAERRRLRITVTAAMTAVVVSMSLALVALVSGVTRSASAIRRSPGPWLRPPCHNLTSIRSGRSCFRGQPGRWRGLARHSLRYALRSSSHVCASA
jgi:hypothetical protein